VQRDLGKLAGLAIDEARAAVPEHQVEGRDRALLHV
jgi:hypothetical protein